MDQSQRTSILSMAMGAINERADYEMRRVIDNILDPNTCPTDKRSVTITLEFKPDSERRKINMTASAKPKFAVTNSVSTSLYVTADEKGEMCVVEMVPQVPGQVSMEGSESPNPAILKFVNAL